VHRRRPPDDRTDDQPLAVFVEELRKAAAVPA